MGSRRMRSAALAALLWMVPAGAIANAPPLEPARNQACARKRTDACGCHHYYGLRHCHPKLKTERCERPVNYTRALPEAHEGEVNATPSSERASQHAVKWVPRESGSSTRATQESL